MLRIRTGYSFHTAFGHIEDVQKRLLAINATFAPITDRNSTFGFNKWTKLAKKNGLRPVYGVELAVTPSLGARKPILDYWTFIAKDSLVPLHELIATATANPGKEPSLTYQQALKADVFKIAGERLLIDHVQDQDDFFLGLSPAVPRGLLNRAIQKGIKLAACSDNYYPTKDDKELYRVALGRRANTQTYPMHILSNEEWNKALGWVNSDEREAALANTQYILDHSNAKLTQATLLAPEKPKTLRQMCEEGAIRCGVDLNNPVYKERLDKELALIAEKKFEDYFYILEDMMRFARGALQVGPARGCFLPNQNVILKDGVYKPIQNVKKGDIVRDAFGKKQTVLGKLKYEINEKIIEFEFEDGDKLSCTQDHKILVAGEWVKAKDIKEGQFVSGVDKTNKPRTKKVKLNFKFKKLIECGWPKRLAQKVINGGYLTIAESKLVPKNSKKKVLLNCKICRKYKKVLVKNLANRMHGLAYKRICGDCMNAESCRTPQRRKSNSKAQLKIQGKLEQRVKNAFGVSASWGGKRSSKYDMLRQFPGYKNLIKKRDNFLCQSPICDRKNNKLHIHHIDGGGDSNPFNVITICPSCHSRYHNFNRYEISKNKALKEQKLYTRIAKRNTNAQGKESEIKKIAALLRSGL